MQIVRVGKVVVVRAPAKVNLFLEILGKRPDGYHEIATLMVAVGLYDRLCFQENPHLRLRCNRDDLSTGPDNLILKAARLLQEKTGCTLGADIHLIKRIPMAAGLAGGSTDAAAALAGLNCLWNLGLESETLAHYSGLIGSDIPFFFHAPAGWCTGRGEKVHPVRVGKRLHFVLVCPPVGLATAEVYRNVTVPEKPLLGVEIAEMLSRGDVDALGWSLHNRLQPIAQRLCPAVLRAYERLREHEPAGALMSGSGSTLFALCRNRSEAERIAQHLRQDSEGERIFVVQSCLEQPPSPP